MKSMLSMLGLAMTLVVAVSVFASPPKVGPKWQSLEVQVAAGSAAPFPTGSFAATAAENGLSGWMFGGVVDDFTESPVYNNRFYRIDPTGNKVKFTQVSTGGAEPTARAFASIAATRQGNRNDVYVFGGGTFPFNIPLANEDAFWHFNSMTNTWTDLTATGGPNARMGATLVAHDGALYVFGGISFDFDIGFFVLHNDLWRFDIASGSWTQLSDGSTGPAARHMAMGAVVDDDKLLFYGGERIEVEFFPEFSIAFPIDTSTWIWDTTTNEWTQLADGPARNYGASGHNGTTMVMFGGDEAGGVTCAGSPFNQATTNDTFTFNLDSGWNQATTFFPPAPVKRTAGFMIGNNFYTLGGFDFTCEDGQVWNTQVHTIKVKN